MVDCLHRDGSLAGRLQELTVTSATGMLRDSGQVLCCISLTGCTSLKFSTIVRRSILIPSSHSQKGVIPSFPFGCRCVWRRSQTRPPASDLRPLVHPTRATSNFLTRYRRIPRSSCCSANRQSIFGYKSLIGSQRVEAWSWWTPTLTIWHLMQRNKRVANIQLNSTNNSCDIFNLNTRRITGTLSPRKLPL